MIPKRSISYRLTAACIISTAQHASPKVNGQRDPARAHVISDKTREDSHSNFINYIICENIDGRVLNNRLGD